MSTSAIDRQRSSGRHSEPCVFHWSTFGSPVIVHAPHTSLHIPASVRAELLLDDIELDAELTAMTDAGVADVLTHLGGIADGLRPTVAEATMSRLVFDPERFPVDDEMEAVGMGLVYTRRADGSPLRSVLAPERLAWYRDQHRAYTEALERVVAASLEQHGTAVIVDLHSYPLIPLGYEDPSLPRPEVCAGTDRYHTPDWLLEATKASLSERFEVGLNSPFSGAYVPGRFYSSDQRVCSVMLEFRRDMIATTEGTRLAAAAVENVVSAATARVSSWQRVSGHG